MQEVVAKAKPIDVQLLKEIRDYPRDFYNYLRMTETVYKKLLSLVFPLSKRKIQL